MNVKLGDFKNKIQILEKSSTKDSLGSPVTVPSVKDDEDILYNIENAIEIEHRKFLRINASKDE